MNRAEFRKEAQEIEAQIKELQRRKLALKREYEKTSPHKPEDIVEVEVEGPDGQLIKRVARIYELEANTRDGSFTYYLSFLLPDGKPANEIGHTYNVTRNFTQEKAHAQK